MGQHKDENEREGLIMSFGTKGSPSICYLIKPAGHIFISLIISLSSVLGAVINTTDFLLGRCVCD